MEIPWGYNNPMEVLPWHSHGPYNFFGTCTGVQWPFRGTSELPWDLGRGSVGRLGPPRGGVPTGLPWCFGVTFMEVPWTKFPRDSCGACVGLPWDFHGNSLGPPGEIGVPMGLPWCFCGTSVVLGTSSTSWNIHGTSMGLSSSHEVPMGLPWHFRGTCMGLRNSNGTCVVPPYDCHHASMGITSVGHTSCHGTSMELSWEFHGTPMALPRQICGASVELPWDFRRSLRVLWCFRGTSVALLWCSHRASM